jgi:hypothetical protein
MEFRWVACLALWTVLSGPVLVDVVGKTGRLKLSEPAPPAGSCTTPSTNGPYTSWNSSAPGR